jgi:hypothetical protein
MIMFSRRARRLSETTQHMATVTMTTARTMAVATSAPGPVIATARAPIPLLAVAIMLFNFTMARRRLPGSAVLIVEPGDQAQGVAPLAGDALVDCALVVAG